MKEKIKNIAKTTYAYSFAAKAVHISLGLIGTIFINRYLGAELKGEYAYIINILNISFTIFNLGIYQSYPFNKRQGMKNIKNKYVNLMIKQSLVYFIIGLIIIPLIAIILPNGADNVLIISISYMYLILNILSHQLSMVASVETFKKKSKALIISELTQFILLGFMFVFLNKNILVPIIIGIIYYTVYIILCMQYLNVKIKLKEHDVEFAKKTLKMGIFPTLFTLFLSLNYRLDIIFLKQYTNTPAVSLADVGLYSVGVQLAQYIWLIPDIFKEVLFNKTSRKDSIREILYCSKISILISLLFLIFILVFGDTLIIALYGNEYAGAVNITKIIFIGVISMCIFKVLNPLYNAKGKFFENFIILFISILINVILNFILIPLYGSIGAAIASVIGYVVCSIVYLFRFMKEYKIKIWQVILINRQDIKDINKYLGKK